VQEASISMMLRLAAVAMSATLAAAQQPAQEGELTKFANRDTKDVQQRLELLTHTLYGSSSRSSRSSSPGASASASRRSRCGSRRATRRSCPPGSSRRQDGSGRRYPAIVMVHGGFHEHFDERWFQKVDDGDRAGLRRDLPEYRGSRGYGAEIYKSDYGTLDTRT
jgi:hypothetical protein